MVTLNPVKAVRGIASWISVRLAERAANKALEARIVRPLRLKPILLPARHGSINIGWIANNGAQLNIDPVQIKAEGYDGVVIRPVTPGARSTVYCTSHDGNTITVGRRPDFVVKMEDLRIEAGFSRAVFFGEQNKPVRPVAPGFEVRAHRCEFYAPPPTALGRTLWLFFGYQYDALFVDCVFDGYELSEHDHYGHGSAGQGWTFIGCVFRSSGAEEIKVRSDTTETAYAGPDVRLTVRDCTFENWHQDHTGRGGAAIVAQGAACHGLIERCVFRAGIGSAQVPSNARAHCVMVSSEGSSYDIDNLPTGTGYGNGHWIIRDSAFWGHSDVPWQNEIIRFGRNGGAQKAAKSATIQRCGVWGQQLFVAITHCDRTLIEGCNTPEIAAHCRDILSMDTRFEAKFPTATRLVPLSEGISR